MDASQIVTIVVGLIAIAGAIYQFAKWATPRVHRYLAVRKYKRMLPEIQMNAMAERISALENQLAWQKDSVETVVKDMFAMNRENLASDSCLLDLIRDMLENGVKNIENDGEQTRRLIAILEGFTDQIDHLWDAHEATLKLIETALKQTHEPQDNPKSPELKSA